VTPLQHIAVSFRVKNQVSGKPVRVHQAFVRFTHVESQSEVVFITKPTDKNRYGLNLPLSAHLADFKGKSGKYQMQLIVGDPFVANPISWDLATININFGRGDNFVSSKSFDKGPLPEIHHQFRAPEKRPQSVISLVFAGLALAPILVLLVVSFSVGGNFSNLPGGAGLLFSFGFQLCLAAILGLFVVYWFVLNVVQTLGYLALLSIPTVFLGLKTLQAVHLNRTKPHTE